ncbi:MAG TPA: hypothetical protein VEY50_04855 [Lysobacter sp.]|nr:hypothetical protein [Lysobacter sp.]
MAARPARPLALWFLALGVVALARFAMGLARSGVPTGATDWAWAVGGGALLALALYLWQRPG